MDFNSEKFDDILIITAAKGRPVPWVREKFSPAYWARIFGESLIYDYKEKMEHLRKVDDQIYEWTKNIEDILREIMTIRKSVSKDDPTRFIDIAILLGQLNKKLIQIKETRSYLEDISEEAKNELAKKYKLELPEKAEHIYDLTPEEKEELFKYKKEAGIKDFFQGKFYERLSRKQDKERKNAVLNLINLAAETVAIVRDTLKSLGSARSSGRIGEYIDLLGKIGKQQEKFQTKFMSVYDKHLKVLVEEALQKTKEEKEQAEKKREELLQPEKDKIKDYLTEKDELEKAKQDWYIKQKELKDAPPKTISQEPVFLEPEKLPSLKLDLPEQPKPESVYEVQTKDLIPDLSDTVRDIKIKHETRPGYQNPAEEPKNPAEEPKKPSSGIQVGDIGFDGKADMFDESKKEKEDNKEVEENGPSTLRSRFSKLETRNFISKLNNLAKQDDPYLVVQAILEHSEYLEDKDPEASLKLLSIVEGLIEG